MLLNTTMHEQTYVKPKYVSV